MASSASISGRDMGFCRKWLEVLNFNARLDAHHSVISSSMVINVSDTVVI